jgi:hypothetical protein
MLFMRNLRSPTYKELHLMATVYSKKMKMQEKVKKTYLLMLYHLNVIITTIRNTTL